MKLGLITDIHEDVEALEYALKQFEREQVDQVVVIGDLFERGERIRETCRLLSDARAIGVWGNHDFGLCVDQLPEQFERYGDAVLDFMSTLKPRLEIDNCSFTHIEPWLDPEDIADLWYFNGLPDSPLKLARIFDCSALRHYFVGHYHKWVLANREAIESWAGESPILLDNDRYFVTVGALCEGHFATFETRTHELRPCVVNR